MKSWGRHIWSWWGALVVVLLGLGAVVDAVGLLLSRASLQPALIAWSVGAATSLLLATLLAVPAAVFARLLSRLGRKLAPIAVIASALAIFWVLLDPLPRRVTAVYIVIVVVAALAVGVAAWLVHAKPTWLARMAAGGMLVGAVVADWWISPSLYPEFHNGLYVIQVASGLSLVTALRIHFRTRVSTRGLVFAVGSIAIAVFTVSSADFFASGWRLYAVRDAVFSQRSARLFRYVVDFDRDGFSSILAGGDCNDFDAAVHPFAVDAPGGGDANCNGVDLSATESSLPTGQTLGFALPPAGSVSAPAVFAPDAVDLVILLTVDTLRGDVVGGDLMPNLESIALRYGTLLSRVYAVSPGTATSLPLIHALENGATPIATTLRQRGVTVTAINGGRGVSPQMFGFKTIIGTPLDAKKTTEAALAQIAKVGQAKHFCWIHYFDPHTPKVPHRVKPPQVRRDLSPAYRSAVRYTDIAIGELVAGLKQTERLDTTAIIMTADHGEGFGEHGVYAHGRSPYDPVLRVPGFVIAPGVRGGRYRHLATHRDIPVTVLAAFGISTQARFGRSWLSLRTVDAPPLHRFVVARSSRYASGAHVDSALGILVQDQYKLVVGYHEQSIALYDLAADPNETTNIAHRLPKTVRKLQTQLAGYNDIDRYPASFPRRKGPPL